MFVFHYEINLRPNQVGGELICGSGFGYRARDKRLVRKIHIKPLKIAYCLVDT